MRNRVKCAKCKDIIDSAFDWISYNWVYCECKAIGLFFDLYGHNTAWAYDKYEDIIFLDQAVKNEKQSEM